MDVIFSCPTESGCPINPLPDVHCAGMSLITVLEADSPHSSPVEQYTEYLPYPFSATGEPRR